MRDSGLASRAAAFHPWDAMAPAALAAILERGPFHVSAETGCGGSTIVLSHASERHFAFAIEGQDRTITELRADPSLRAEAVDFIEGETRHTLPGWRWEGRLDFVLLDGPHAYPMPQFEYACLCPRIAVGGWLALDDLQIPSVYELFRFLKKEPSFELDAVVTRTAFFRRVAEVDLGPDGWERQGINRRTVLRYGWRDRARRLLGRG